jgi:hypothetical protein
VGSPCGVLVAARLIAVAYAGHGERGRDGVVSAAEANQGCGEAAEREAGEPEQ